MNPAFYAECTCDVHTGTGPHRSWCATEKTQPRVVGLDLSITATGIAWCDGTTYTVASKATGDRRLPAIVSEVARAVEGRLIDLVVIEDLPTHAKSAGITGMVHGAVRAYLLRGGVRYALVTPASLKKYATGKGNAGKPEMAVAAYKRLGRELADDNQVDALWLRAAGLDHLGHPLADMPKTHRAALDAVTWPDLPATNLAAIDAIHQPFTRAGEQWCTGCSHGDGARYHFLAAWPCATNKAISTATPDA